MTAAEKIADKISKLLRQAEGAGTQAEADTFSEKAEQLIIKYQIDRAILESKGEAVEEKMVKKNLIFKGIYGKAKITAFNVMIKSLKSVVLWRDGISCEMHNADVLTIFGFESEVEMAFILATSLELQLNSSQAKWWKTVDSRGWTAMMKFKDRREFIYGFGQTVAQRLATRRTTEVKAAGTGTDLVLVDRHKKVELAAPALGKARGGRRAGGSYESSAAGRAAGSAADLGGGKLGGSGKALER